MGSSLRIQPVSRSSKSLPSSGLFPYLISLILVAVAFLTRLLLWPVVQRHFPFLLFLLAVVGAAWLGGRGPGLLAAALGGLVSWYFFLGPPYSFRIADTFDAVKLAYFMLFGIGAVLLLDRLKSARREGGATAEILESISDGFVALDHEFRFTYVNQAAENLMDRPKTELLGKSIWEVYPELVGTIVETNYRRVLDEQRPLRFEHRYSANRWSEITAFPAAGRGLSVYFREITDDKQAQAIFREKEERYQFNLEAANAGTWDWNIATGAVLWSDNMESVHGQPPGSFTGTLESFFQFVHYEDRDSVRQKIGRAIESGEQYVVEYRTVGPDGKVSWMEAKGRVSYDERTGQPKRMMGVSTNITERKAAEIALRESEERFRTLARHAPVGIFQLDSKGSCLFTNERWRMLSGMTQEEALRDGWMRAIHPDDLDRILRVRQEGITRGRPYAAEYRIIGPGGKVSWIEAVAVPMRNNAGEVTGYIGTTTDITEHKLWEGELERTKKRVTDVLESITEMFIAVDSQWRFTYANQATVETTGKPLEEILGKNIWELFPEIVATNFHSQCERVMTERVPVHFEFIGPRGSWFDVHAHPAEDGLSAYILDVTKRKKSEEALFQLAAIVDSTDDAIVSVKLDGTVLTWNSAAEKIHGYTAQEILGRNIRLIVPPDRLDEAVRILERLERGESVRHFETIRVNKDGRSIWISLTASPIRDRDGKVVAASAISRDITELKELEEQLRQTAKLESLGVLAGGIAHDFNNLLVGILGNASLVSDMLPATSPARLMLDDVINASERAAMLTRQLLAYSGRGKFNIQSVDISELTRELANLVQASVPRKVALRLRLEADLPAVVADIAQVQQLIMNLVINGAEAIGDSPGTVTITTGVQEIVDGESIITGAGGDPITPGRYVFFEVQDNGAGMDEATKAKIFDPFFTTKFTGRGLGLSAALGIVRGHKGFIQVASTPGRGSTFKVLFPAAEEKKAPRQVREVKDEVMGSGVILIVDDEELVRRTASTTLAHRGYTVLEASNGLEAIEVFEKDSSRIALVVLDLSMPVMSGEECLSRLKAIRPDVPVLLSSGFSEAEAARRFQAAGVASFLQKPYTAQQLARLVKVAMDSAKIGASQDSA
jgi:PAS domain S-box-containing protein